MASSQDQDVFQCSGCQEELDLDSKTLSCFHSFCRSCLDRHFGRKTNGKGQCPECHEPSTLDQLSLSPFLVRSLRRRQLESTDWKCDLCLKDEVNCTARNWCHDCQKLFCANCSRFHMTFQPKHNVTDLEGIEKDKAIQVMVTYMCSLHKKPMNLYCERCNVCFCDTCYKDHSADSPECKSRPLSVREVALKQKSQGPTLDKETDNLEMSLRSLNKRIRHYTEELNSDCNSKCQQLWADLEEMMENAKRKTNKLCEEMRKITAEQVKRWHHLLEENDKILKQLEIWRINFHHLLNESQQDVDVVCGLRLLGAKLSSQLHKSVGPEERCQLEVTFSNWWPAVLEQLRSKKIGLASLRVEKLPAKNLICNKEWNLHGSNSWIVSIYVNKDDDHVFLCDNKNQSIIEYTEWGELVCECLLFKDTNKFSPVDMCSISPDILVVCGYDKKLIFLKREKIPPFLQIKKIIHTEKNFYSLCQINETIFACDDYFQIDSFTKDGERIKTIKTCNSLGLMLVNRWPRFHADPLNGNFWVTRMFSSEIFCSSPNGQELQSAKTEEKISDFCVNEFGHLYFCTKEGIFSFSTKKILCEFEKKSESFPRMFTLRNTIFVSLKIDGRYSIKIFRIFF